MRYLWVLREEMTRSLHAKLLQVGAWIFHLSKYNLQLIIEINNNYREYLYIYIRFNASRLDRCSFRQNEDENNFFFFIFLLNYLPSKTSQSCYKHYFYNIISIWFYSTQKIMTNSLIFNNYWQFSRS